MKSNGFSTTRLIVQIECSTQFGPEAAVNMIQNALRFPAVRKVEVQSIQSNFNHWEQFDEMVDVPVPVPVPWPPLKNDDVVNGD